EALDDEHDRFSRRNDLYSLEVALIKAGNSLRLQPPLEAQATAGADTAVQGRPVSVQPPAAADEPPSPEPAATKTRKTRSPEAPTAERQSQQPGRAFSWHAVKTAAGPQLKAFLQPAAGADEGSTVSLTYDERFKFHFEQLVKRREELESLIESVAGPGYDLQIVGPDGRKAGGGAKKA